jgi:hypothetical protein
MVNGGFFPVNIMKINCINEVHVEKPGINTYDRKFAHIAFSKVSELLSWNTYIQLIYRNLCEDIEP